MPLINTSVPNLIQGVSQQPDATRFDGQCEEQENALSSVAEGLKKRPNTRHIAKLLDTAIEEDSFVHFINRSDTEKYVVLHDGTKLYAWNTVTGVESTINGATGGYTPAANHYLNTVSARQALKALTLGDSTFLLNTNISVAPKTLTTTPLKKEGVVFVTQGGYEKNYRVDVRVTDADGNDVAATPPTMPEFSITMSRYTYDTQRINAYNDYNRITYRWRVASLQVIAAGANITGNISITVTSNKAIYSNPNLDVNISNGSVTSVTVVNGGSFEGITNTDDYSYSSTGRYTYLSTSRQGYRQPTLSHVVTGGSVGSNSEFFARYKSEDSNDSDHANSSTIAEGLKDEMNSAYDASFGGGLNGVFTVTQPTSDSNVYLELVDQTKEFSITTRDDLSNSGLSAAYKEIDSISSLPASNKDGFRIKIRGDAELSADDYYVEFSTNSNAVYGQGVYTETVGFGIEAGYDAGTMPHILKSDAVNSFVIMEGDYADRMSGDDDTNPLPSFVGQPIDNIFFFKNRLGFLSRENIVMSESGLGVLNEQGDMQYNFGRTSVTTLLDSDPIDVSVASSRVTNLKSAKGFQENLILFSENGQFVMKGGDVLTPRTVSITPVTNFSVEDKVEPLPLGSYIYFPFTRGAFTGLREYTVNASTDVYDSAEVTEHVPAYIPKDIIDIAGTTSEDMIALLSNEEKGSLYVYNYFWNNQQKVLSAWSKFTFTGEIRGIDFIESTLYMVITNNGQTNLVEMPLESGLSDEAGYVTHLDMRVAHKVHMRNFRFTGATGVAAHLNNVNYGYDFEINGAQGYHSVPPSPEDSEILRGADGKWYVYELGGVTYAMSTAGYTQYPWDADWTGTALANATFSFNGARDTINLPYTPEDNSVQVYTTDGLALGCTNSGYRVTLTNPLSTDTDVWVGIPYTMKYTFSEQLFKAKAGNGTSPSNAAKMRIRNGSVYYADSAYFKVKVTPKFRDTYVNTFTPDVVGSSTIGSLTLGSGFYRFPVFTKPLDTTITIENESALPSTFQSAEFESFVHSRSNRYG
jgi:hypothetical protein